MNLYKQDSFLRVRGLLADELIFNMQLQRQYNALNISFEGSELEREFVKLESRWRNENHLNKINRR